MSRRYRYLFLIPASLLAAAAPLPAQTYSEYIDISLYGYLDQYSMNASHNFVGNEACIPTSSTNALTYLQNAYSSVYGSSLSGSTYTSWKATDSLLIADMGTTASEGTYYTQFVYGLNQFFDDQPSVSKPQFSGMFYDAGWGGLYPKPSYVTEGHPTAEFMAESLDAGAALITLIEYTGGGGGHGILVNGFTWDSSTSTGTLLFIDPLNPSQNYSDTTGTGPTLQTTGTLTLNEFGNLLLTYDQYEGGLPYSSGEFSTVSAVIDGALALTVPEPSTWMLTGLGLALCLGMLRRRTGILSHPR